MLRSLRSATLVVALSAGLAWLAGVAPSPATAATAARLVALPGDGAARLGNQQQVVAPRPPPPRPATSLADQVIALTNAERAAAGLGAVTAHPDLMEAASAHSHDQASMQRMTHIGSDGSNAGTRITRAGYSWRTWAENVAFGYSSAAAVVTGWMGSAGHRTNMLNGSFVHIGVAAVTGADGRLYWTMVLAA